MSDAQLIFSSSKQSGEWPILHPQVRVIVQCIANIHDLLGWDTEVTSCVRLPGEIPGESGVHATGRACDCVARMRPNSCPGPIAVVAPVVASLMNFIFRRHDQFSSVLWHSVGYGFHYHAQVPYDPSYNDLAGVAPQIADKF